MNFVIGANIPPLRTTGMGRQMFGVGAGLERLGHEVAYLFDDAVDRLMPRRLSRLEFPLRVAARLSRTGRESTFALLHEPTAWASALYARRRGVRVLSMVHACELKVWKETLRDADATGETVRLSSRVLWPATELWQSWLSLKTSDLVFCLSTDDRDYITRRLGVPPERVVRIDNGVEPEFLSPRRSAPRDRDILFLASWLPRKGIRFFASALAGLTAGGITPSLTIAGTGIPEVEVRRALPEPFRNTATVLSAVQPDELIALYERHRLFVLPSVSEGIPLSLLEAMACGVCPIASRVGGIPDVLTDGVDGRLIRPKDPGAILVAMTELLADKALAERLGSTARRKMQDYAWDRAARQIAFALAERRLDRPRPGEPTWRG